MGIITKGIETYAGLVVSLSESTFDCGYETSYHAQVWNWDTMSTETVTYNSTMHGPDGGRVTIDETPEVVAAYNYKQELVIHERAMREMQEDTMRPFLGGEVIVTKGRLVPKGTVLQVSGMWMTDYGGKLSGFTADGVKHTTYLKNVENLYSLDNMRSGLPVKPVFPEIVTRFLNARKAKKALGL